MTLSCTVRDCAFVVPELADTRTRMTARITNRFLPILRKLPRPSLPFFSKINPNPDANRLNKQPPLAPVRGVLDGVVSYVRYTLVFASKEFLLVKPLQLNRQSFIGGLVLTICAGLCFVPPADGQSK